MQVDAIDLELLAALQVDARLSNKELAARVGLAPSSTHTRLKRLVSAGVLRGTRAEVAPEAAGVGLTALVFVRLERHAQGAIEALWAKLTSLDEVVGAWSVGGHDDLVLHVAVEDANHLRDLVLTRVPAAAEVGKIRTELVFRHFSKPIPLFARQS